MPGLRTRKRIVRGLFLALGVVPLLVTFSWASWRSWHDTASRLADRWSRQLGLDVELVQVEHTSPGIMRLEGLHIADPESGRPMVLCSSVTLMRHGSSMTIECQQLAIRAAHLPELWNLLSQRVLRQPDVWGASFELKAPRAKLVGGTSDVEWQDLELRVENSDAGREANLTMTWDDQHDPSTVRIVRRTAGLAGRGPAYRRVHWDTGPTPISCSLMPWPLDWLQRLGRESHFQGVVWIDEDKQGLHGELTGHITRVDLTDSLSDRWDVEMAGSVDLAVRKLTFSDGRVGEMEGVIHGGPVTISPALLSRFAEEFNAPLDFADTPLDQVDLAQIRFGVRLDQGGIELVGTPDGVSDQGVLLSDENMRLGIPPSQPVPTTALIKTIVPSSTMTLPINASSEALMRVLPLGRSDQAAQSPRPTRHQ